MSFTLLWVEDDPNDILLGGRALQKAGFEKPVIARDGEQAVAYLRGQGKDADREAHPLPSLVLLDLKLPRLSGFEVLRWIREQPQLRRIPVVILTSSREQIDVDRAYELGANAYLVKPVETQLFLEILQSLHSFWARFNRSPEIHPQPSDA